MPCNQAHELFCNICSEVAYTFEGCADSHHGQESTCPDCGARGHVDVDMEDGMVCARWFANCGEWERIQQEEECARIVLEMGYDSWKELFYDRVG